MRLVMLHNIFYKYMSSIKQYKARDYVLEKRIAERQSRDISLGICSYGSMGQESVAGTKNEHIIKEEIAYMKQHPEIYIKENKNMYLIKLD
jgi:hypothetical protein